MAKVLLIDDEWSVLDMIGKALRRKDYHVVQADSGQKGIEEFRQERPDVTILDINMPHMNGIAVLKEIRAIDPQAAVIIRSGANTENAERQARELGVTEFLVKEFSLHTLGAAVKNVLRK